MTSPSGPNEMSGFHLLTARIDRAIVVFLLVTTLSGYASAQLAERPTGFPVACAPGEVQVMLLGTYHFANPGKDVIKQNYDDV
jgi:hypothetical protein